MQKYYKYKTKYLILKGKQIGGSLISILNKEYVSFNDIKNMITNKISSGSEGTIYKISYNDKIYAMKISNINKNDIENSLASPHWREIFFARYMDHKYPNQFMKLYASKIIQCRKNYTIIDINNIYPRSLRKMYHDRITSGYCSIKIYNFIDYTLTDIIGQLDLMQIYSGIVQLAYIIYLIRKEKFIHNDFGPNNVGIKKTSKTYINIHNYRIPTYGYVYVALDYGKILHHNFILSKNEKKELDADRTDTYSIQFILDHNSYLESDIRNKIDIPQDDVNYILNNIDNPLSIIEHLCKKYFE
jgi:hypothetical protein